MRNKNLQYVAAKSELLQIISKFKTKIAKFRLHPILTIISILFSFIIIIVHVGSDKGPEMTYGNTSL